MAPISDLDDITEMNVDKLASDGNIVVGISNNSIYLNNNGFTNKDTP